MIEEHYETLAIFSGIGFENLVGRVRSFYFKRANKGGNKGRGKYFKQFRLILKRKIKLDNVKRRSLRLRD